MNSVKIIAVIIALLALDSCGEGFKCNTLRDYNPSTDKKIATLRDKIESLESEKIKDLKTTDQLVDAYTQLGTIYLEKRMWDNAIDSFHKCIRNGGYGSTVYYSIGLAYANRGKDTGNQDDINLAESNYRKAIDMSAENDDVKYALAILLFYHKDQKEPAINLLEEAISGNRKYYKARFALGKFYYEINRLDKSLNTYEDLYTDLDKLSSSQMIEEYKSSCKSNIQLIMVEMSKSKEK